MVYLLLRAALGREASRRRPSGSRRSRR